MHGPTCIVLANLTPFSIQVDAYCDASGDAPPPLEAEDRVLIAAAEGAVRADEQEEGGVGEGEGEGEEEELLSAAALGCVVWATGFEHDFSWLRGFDERLFDDAGYPVTDTIVGDGSSPAAEGLHFSGLNWMNARKSGILLGANADAAAVAATLTRRFCEGRGSKL
jgi:hypothetical protein